MVTIDGCIIAFPNGARGRLIANIISKMLIGTTEGMQFTKYASSHNHLADAYIRTIWDYKTFTLENDNPNNFPPILLAHGFPEIDIIDSNDVLKNKKILVINIDHSDVDEVVLNNIMKSLMPRIEDMVNNKPLEDVEVNLIAQWQTFYNLANITFSEKILTDPGTTKKFLGFAVGNPMLRKTINPNFFERVIPDSERVMNLRYKDLFARTVDGKYETLEKLAMWLGVPYTDSVYSDFEKYESQKDNVFKKFYPEFLK